MPDAALEVWPPLDQLCMRSQMQRCRCCGHAPARTELRAERRGTVIRALRIASHGAGPSLSDVRSMHGAAQQRVRGIPLPALCASVCQRTSLRSACSGLMHGPIGERRAPGGLGVQRLKDVAGVAAASECAVQVPH